MNFVYLLYPTVCANSCNKNGDTNISIILEIAKPIIQIKNIFKNFFIASRKLMFFFKKRQENNLIEKEAA